MIKVQINLVGGGKMPVKGTDGAACYDVYARKIEQEGGMVKCYLGIKTKLPEGYKGVVTGRSNTTKYPYVLIKGTIDGDYREEWQARFRATESTKVYKSWFHRLLNIKPKTKYPEFPYRDGERVAQIYFDRVEYLKWNKSKITDATMRTGGFGSTGTK